MSTGIQLIAKERKRQITAEGYSSKHDDQHTDGSLAMAAACYAAPERIYFMNVPRVNRVEFLEPWPWDDMYDKRYSYGECTANPGNVLPTPSMISTEQRIDLLTKAGALIAAEIDRLNRLSP